MDCHHVGPSISIEMCTNIYIYIERERDPERSFGRSVVRLLLEDVERTKHSTTAEHNSERNNCPKRGNNIITFGLPLISVGIFLSLAGLPIGPSGTTLVVCLNHDELCRLQMCPLAIEQVSNSSSNLLFYLFRG